MGIEHGDPHRLVLYMSSAHLLEEVKNIERSHVDRFSSYSYPGCHQNRIKLSSGVPVQPWKTSRGSNWNWNPAIERGWIRLGGLIATGTNLTQRAGSNSDVFPGPMFGKARV